MITFSTHQQKRSVTVLITVLDQEENEDPFLILEEPSDEDLEDVEHLFGREGC
jgi:hypothetical protein